MRKPRIREIPTIKGLVSHAQGFVVLKLLLPVFRPLLRRFSVDVSALEEVLAESADLVRQTRAISEIPDRFNGLFADRGWIIYDRMDLGVAESAIRIAQKEGLEAAETYLADYYGGETVHWGVQAMYAVEAFRPRLALAEKAQADYAEGRYHACVPVVLALLDGMINEVHQKARGSRRGISAAGVNLVAWDSFAAHSSGLMRLAKIFQTGRRKTTTEPLSLPYRNGIMHGIDLGYDNRLVAAKCWCALFAAREWAIKAERKELEKPNQPKRTWREAWAQLKESGRKSRRWEEHKRWAAQWQPRVFSAPIVSEQISSGTPEHALLEFLALWQAANFGRMAALISMFQGANSKRGPAQVRRVFGARRLSEYEILAITDENFARTEILTRLNVTQNGASSERRYTVSMMYTGLDGLPALFGYSEGRWCIMNWTFDQPDDEAM